MLGLDARHRHALNRVGVRRWLLFASVSCASWGRTISRRSPGPTERRRRL